jgi:hypothetical protein
MQMKLVGQALLALVQEEQGQLGGEESSSNVS